jgi:hypothetical protein
MTIEIKKVSNWVCAISGSKKTERIWIGGRTETVIDRSPLEDWIRKREPDFQPKWQHRSTQTYTILARSCGVSGISCLSKSLFYLDRGIIEELGEVRIAALVKVMREGTREDQEKLVQAIFRES